MRWRSVTFGLLISALFLYLALRKTDLAEVWAYLGAANYLLLIPASLVTLFAFWIRAVRWGVLLHPVKTIGSGTLFSAVMIGFMCNNVLPMRLGEVVRAYVIGRSARIRASAAFATIVIERLFDLFAMLAMLGAVLILAPFHNRPFKLGALAALVAGAVALAFLLLVHIRGEGVLSWVGRFLPRLVRARVLGMLRSFQQGLEIFRHPGRLLVIGLLTFLMWFCFVIVIQLCFASAHLQAASPAEGGVPLGVMAGLVVMIVIGIGIMVPSGPGFVGTLQAAAIWGLAIVDYRATDRALSFSILYHATQWFPIVLVGILFLAKEGLSFAQVGRVRGEELGPSGGSSETAPGAEGDGST